MGTTERRAEIQGLEIQIGREATIARIPCLESESDYLVIEELLLAELCRRPATNWIIDLSEHAEGITLVLAGVLAQLGDEARRSRCTIRCAGLQKPGEKCGAGCRTASVSTGRAARRGWMGVTEEPSYLHG